MYFSSDGEESAKNPLVVDLETRDEQTQHKLNAWFGKVCSFQINTVFLFHF